MRNYTGMKHTGRASHYPMPERSALRSFNRMYLRAHYLYGVPGSIGFVAGGPKGAALAIAAVPEVIAVPFIAGGMRR